MERFPPDLMLIAKRELGETPQVKRDAVAQLRKLLAEELALKYPLDEEFLVKFLRCRKYRVKETLEVIRKYFRVRRKYTDIFDNLLPSRILFDEIFRQNKLISILKQPDAQGRLIVICKPGNAKLSSSQHCFTVDLALCRICELSCMDVSQKVDNSCMFAVHTIMIMEGLLLLSPSDCVRVKKIIVCRSKLLEMYINFNFSNTGILQFLPWVVLIDLTFWDVIFFQIHIIGRDYEKLHKLIPRERLPKEYGGTLDEYDYDDLERNLLSQENFFVELGSYGYQ
ncbi:unnamed protein product [Ixodes persulcatus]